MQMRKGILFFIFSFCLFAQNPPSEPKLPTVSDPASKENEKAKSNPKKNLYKVSLTLKLCDGRIVSGEFEYEKNEVNLHHVKDGIKYQKNIFISDIKKILIHSWIGKKLKKTIEGWTYSFEPEDVTIYLKKDFYKMKGMPSSEFQKLSIQNENGTAILYTYWRDLHFGNGKWFTGLSSPKQGIREECHPDVIKTIEFNKED